MIISNKIALIADIHIGVNKNSPEYLALTKRWIQYFIDECIKEKIQDVFVLGDWHHYRDEISVDTLDASAEIMGFFPDNIRVHILTGNHDCFLKTSSEIHSLQMFKKWQNVFIYDKVTRLSTRCLKTITLVPWGCENEKVEHSDYVFGHFEIANFKMNNYTVCKSGTDSANLLKSGSVIYTGHFHKKQEKQYKNGKIAYLGSPFQHDFNDIGNENGYHILDLESGNCEFKINDDSYPKYEYIKASKLKDVTEGLIKGNFVKLFIDIELSESQIEKIYVKLKSFEPVNLIVDDINYKKVLDNSDLSVNIEVLNLKMAIGEYVKHLDDKIKNPEAVLKRINKYYEQKQ